MFTDNFSDAVWLTHVQSDGSQIGGCDPLKYGVQPIPGKRLSLLLSTEGSSDPKGAEYPAFMAYPSIPRAIPPNTGNVSQSFKFTVGGNLAGMNVLETDLLLVIGGWKFNGSCQFVQGKGYEIVDADGEWQSANVNPIGKLSANLKYEAEITYVFNTTN